MDANQASPLRRRLVIDHHVRLWKEGDETTLNSKLGGRGARIVTAATAPGVEFAEDNDGRSSCVRLPSDAGCKRPVFACGRTGEIGGRDGRLDYTAAHFALHRETARIVEDDQFIAAFESWIDFGYQKDETRDRSDAPLYDVTLDLSAQTREPMPGEADVTVVTEDTGCVVVHVDACVRRLGLYCEWEYWERGVAAKPRSRAVELTFSRTELGEGP